MKSIKLKIDGMHCRSCEVLLEQNLLKIPGVESAHVNHSSGMAVIHCSRDVSLSDLQGAVKDTHYTVELAPDDSAGDVFVFDRNHVESFVILVLVVGLYFLLRGFDIFPSGVGLSDSVSYGLALFMGILASLSTCLAVTGGLLVGISARYSEQYPDVTGYKMFRPHLFFNIGRIVSYTILGGIVGLVGSSFSLSPSVNGIFTIIVSLVMILLGFQLLNVFPSLQRFNLRMPKFFAHKIHQGHSSGNIGPFFLGVLTFFLPCGFTQVLQLYVLTTGSFFVGAFTMFSFSLGTLPALLALGALSSYSFGGWKHYFLKIAGGVVLLFGFLSLIGGLTLAGIHFDGASPYIGNFTGNGAGTQKISLKVVGLDYSPSNIILKKGVPVELSIDGSRAQGCAQIFTIPSLGITKRLSRERDNIISFTPRKLGDIYFTCNMGMAGPGTFQVVE